MGITSNKDINELCRKAMRLGWRVFQTGRNHLRWVPPDEIVAKYGRAYVTTSLTPSDVHAINQIERDLRKAGLWHLEETLDKAKLEQTAEEKYLDLGTSLPIPLRPDNPTLRDVAPPELIRLNGSAPKHTEVGSMAKTKHRENRSGLRAAILRVLAEANKPMNAEQILELIPAADKQGAHAKMVVGAIANINRTAKGSVRTITRGVYVIGDKDATTESKAPQTPNGPSDQEVLDNALAAIAALEKLVNRLRQESAAMEAVRKLLGAR